MGETMIEDQLPVEETELIEVDTTPAAVFEKVQTERLRMIAQKDVRDDPQLMLMAMRDAARTAKDQMQLNVEKDGIAAQHETARQMAALLAKTVGNPFKVDNAERKIDLEKFEDGLEAVPVVKGELECESEPMSYRTFFDVSDDDDAAAVPEPGSEPEEDE